MADIPSVKVICRLGLMVGDGPDPDELPDVIWCDAGSVILTPLNTFSKVVNGSPVPWMGGDAQTTLTLDSQGFATLNSKRYTWVFDLTSSAVSPAIGSGKATHAVKFSNVTAQGTPVNFPNTTARISTDSLTTVTDPAEASLLGISVGDQVLDLTLATPLPAPGGTPIVPGPRGTGIETLSVVGNALVATLTDGSTQDTTLPAAMVDSDTFIASKVPASSGSATAAALSAAYAPGGTAGNIDKPTAQGIALVQALIFGA